MACSVSSIPARSRSTSATNAPSRANNMALARPMPEPAPVTIAIRSFKRMSSSLPMTNPPIVQVRRRIRATEASPPTEFVFHARNRERRAIGFGVQVDRERLARPCQAADKPGMQTGEMLPPLQRRPLAPSGNVVELVSELRRLDQKRHGIGDIGGVNPVADPGTGKHCFSLVPQRFDDLKLRAQRIANPRVPLPGPEHATEPNADKIGLP